MCPPLPLPKVTVATWQTKEVLASAKASDLKQTAPPPGNLVVVPRSILHRHGYFQHLDQLLVAASSQHHTFPLCFWHLLTSLVLMRALPLQDSKNFAPIQPGQDASEGIWLVTSLCVCGNRYSKRLPEMRFIYLQLARGPMDTWMAWANKGPSKQSWKRTCFRGLWSQNHPLLTKT